jgi:sulfur carrier protein
MNQSVETSVEISVEIELNGAPHRITDHQTLHDLIASLALADQALAVAVNREVVPRQLWSRRALQARDRVDIVRAIGGG